MDSGTRSPQRAGTRRQLCRYRSWSFEGYGGSGTGGRREVREDSIGVASREVAAGRPEVMLQP